MLRSCVLLLTGLVSVLTLAYAKMPVEAEIARKHDSSDVHLARVTVMRSTQLNRAPKRAHVHHHNHTHQEFIRPPRKRKKEEPTLLPILHKESIKPKDRELLHKVLTWMPVACRGYLENLVLRYDPKTHRGQATSRSIILRGGMSAQETAAVLIHECGHIADLGALKGRSSSGKSKYPDGNTPVYNDDPSVEFYEISWKNSKQQRADARSEDFVSGYAQHDPFEDVAESIIYYALHREAFEQRAIENKAIAAKLAWVKKYVYPPTFQTAKSKPWDGDIVWDITKLPHELEL